MPELPEVETVRRGLLPYIVGRRLSDVVLYRRELRHPLGDAFEERLMDRVLLGIDRRAKYLLFRFEGGVMLLAHLGMSGSLTLKAGHDYAPRKHDHVVFGWEGEWTLAFHDPRRFGLMLAGDEVDIRGHKLLAGLGPEPFDATLDPGRFHALLASSRAPVKTVIMDQRKLVGVGNIYACEALFASGIHPERPANKVTGKEAGRLLAAIRSVLEDAIESGGSTLRDYVRSSGEAGYFQHHFRVYGRAGKPCAQCGRGVLQIRQAGRSSFYCAHCQK